MRLKDDLDTLAEVRPYLRAGVALLVHLFRGLNISMSYDTADEVIRQLEKDVTARLEEERR